MNTIAIMTNSGTFLATAEFPLYLIDYRGRCERLDKTSNINKEETLPSGLIFKTQVKNILQNPKNPDMISVEGIVSAQQEGDDFKFSMMSITWLDTDNEPHYGILVRKHSSKTRTVESDYESTILDALSKVRENAVKSGLNLPFLKNSYLVMESIDGLSMDFWDEDYLLRLIGTRFYNKGNPLNRGLYTFIEHEITSRNVHEYRVVKTF